MQASYASESGIPQYPNGPRKNGENEKMWGNIGKMGENGGGGANEGGNGGKWGEISGNGENEEKWGNGWELEH